MDNNGRLGNENLPTNPVASVEEASSSEPSQQQPIVSDHLSTDAVEKMSKGLTLGVNPQTLAVMDELSQSLEDNRESLRDITKSIDQLAGKDSFQILQNAKLMETFANFGSNLTVKLPQQSLKAMLNSFDRVSNVVKLFDQTSYSPQLANSVATILESLRSINLPEYSRPKEKPEWYSSVMKSPADYFDYYAPEIGSVSDLNQAIIQLSRNTGDAPLVWRGQDSASWGLNSKLYRRLMKQNGVQDPAEHPKKPQPYPDETQMVDAEALILNLAWEQWRLGNMPALEIFARIQHFGGPTRLLDATRNPYIATWFAVQEQHEDENGRLFALSTSAVGNEPVKNLSVETQKYDPFWFNAHTVQERSVIEWGTGSRRLVWVPPVYESRIAAQNAVFILDGTPITTNKVLQSFPIPPKLNGMKRQHWKRPDILAAASIYVKMFKPQLKPRSNKLQLAPTFNFLIKATAKKSIREYLEKTFGYSNATIYPDIPGLAERLENIQYPKLKLDASSRASKC